MSGIKQIQRGSIEIIHHSAASVYQIKITYKDPSETADFEERKEEVWLDYWAMSNLLECLKTIEEK